ncbi:MAG: hypothetical protein NZ602_09365 [Thermoguttaceae bacterium]|nr:hypothetical protein [Thermoguttaceae bacterium]MDW8039103.1 hypothetical protein [Thermoguttaceae bacterium]
MLSLWYMGQIVSLPTVRKAVGWAVLAWLLVARLYWSRKTPVRFQHPVQKLLLDGIRWGLCG